MTRFIHVASLLAVVAVPVFGWFAADWSGPTTLAVYWFETVAVCVFILARIAVHQRWSPRRGHFRYAAPNRDGRGSQNSTFISGFAVTSLVFCAAHGVFLAAILFILSRNGQSELAGVDWRSVGIGCASVLLFLAVDFFLDLLSLRQWSFWQVEQTANYGLSRVVVVHLTLILGFVGIAITGASDALFGVFVVLKTMSAMSFAVPQWEPTAPPKWLSRIMNRVPNVHPGKRFEEFWEADRVEETTRRERNEQPWTGPRR